MNKLSAALLAATFGLATTAFAADAPKPAEPAAAPANTATTPAKKQTHKRAHKREHKPAAPAAK